MTRSSNTPLTENQSATRFLLQIARRTTRNPKIKPATEMLANFAETFLPADCASVRLAVGETPGDTVLAGEELLKSGVAEGVLVEVATPDVRLVFDATAPEEYYFAPRDEKEIVMLWSSATLTRVAKLV